MYNFLLLSPPFEARFLSALRTHSTRAAESGRWVAPARTSRAMPTSWSCFCDDQYWLRCWRGFRLFGRSPPRCCLHFAATPTSADVLIDSMSTISPGSFCLLFHFCSTFFTCRQAFVHLKEEIKAIWWDFIGRCVEFNCDFNCSLKIIVRSFQLPHCVLRRDALINAFLEFKSKASHTKGFRTKLSHSLG